MCLTLAALQAANSRFRLSQTPSLSPTPRPARRMRAPRSGSREIYRPPSRVSPRPCYLCLSQACRSRGLPWRTATPRQAMARPQSARATLSATLRARRWPLTGPDARSELSRPQFVGDDAQLTEVEREQMVARKVALRNIPARGVHLGLLMDFVVSGATSTAERDAVPVLLDDGRQRGFRPRTLEGDRGYDTRQCVNDMGDLGVTPQCAQMA